MRARLAALFFVLAASSPALLRAAHDGGPRDPRCRAFDEENGKTYALLAGCPECLKLLHENLEPCHGDAHGVWSYRLDDVEMRTGEHPESAANLPTLKVRFTLARHDDGSTVPLASAPGVTPFNKGAGPNWTFEDAYWGSIPSRPIVFFDYDGDGVDEVLLSSFEKGEGTMTSDFEIWTSRGGSVVPYPTSVSTPLTRIEDVDGDGRPDLVTLEVHAEISAAMGDPRQVGPDIVHHSLPGGRFDARDPVARRAFEASCAPQLRSFDGVKAPIDGEELAMRIMCMRAAGKSPTEVRAAASAFLRDAGGAPGEIMDPASVIDAEPSFHL